MIEIKINYLLLLKKDNLICKFIGGIFESV